MVVFVGHTLLLRRIGFDVNNIPHAVVDKEGRELRWTTLCKTSQRLR